MSTSEKTRSRAGESESRSYRAVPTANKQAANKPTTGKQAANKQSTSKQSEHKPTAGQLKHPTGCSHVTASGISFPQIDSSVVPHLELEEISVLLVEDNDGDFVLTREMLNEASRDSSSLGHGFILHRASRLSEAKEILATETISVVLLDLSLPDSGGLGALDELQESYPNHPVVLFTGHDDISLARRAVFQGAHDYLVKGRIDAGLLSRSLVYAVERKRAELERKKLEARLAMSAKLESLGVLAGGLAHDLNNLLQGMLSCSNMALRFASGNNEVTSRLIQIEAIVGDAAALISKLFACSGKVSMISQRVNLSQFISNQSVALRLACNGRAELSLEPQTELPEIEIDVSHLKQILLNLVHNASEAMASDGAKHKGKIKVRTGRQTISESAEAECLCNESCDREYVFLEVSDTGVGMDRDTSERIFEPFFTTKTFGRGLGLASVLGIVRSYDGVMTVESEPGVGTTFRVLFPL